VTELRQDFRERVGEVEAFIHLVAGIENSVQNGIPLVGRRSGKPAVVEPLQQKLLYAGVYLHLYNLVEATVSRCIAAVESAASVAGKWRAGDLSGELRSEWVKSVARTHETLNTENRLQAAIEMCEHVIAMLPVDVRIVQGGGGNWDDDEIYRFARRLGVHIILKKATYSSIKRPFRDDKGPIGTIKSLRNKLAHGEMSFSECGEGLSADRLEELKELTVSYLWEVIECFEGFIERHDCSLRSDLLQVVDDTSSDCPPQLDRYCIPYVFTQVPVDDPTTGRYESIITGEGL